MVSFKNHKNQNWEMYCSLIVFYDPKNDNNFWNLYLGQISHVILSHFIWGGGTEGLGQGCVKITLTVSCLEWLTCLLWFIMVEFEKLQPWFKNGTHFSFYESLSKGYNVQMSLCLTLSWDAMSHNGHAVTMWWPRQFVQTPSQEKKICIPN